MNKYHIIHDFNLYYEILKVLKCTTGYEFLHHVKTWEKETTHTCIHTNNTAKTGVLEEMGLYLASLSVSLGVTMSCCWQRGMPWAIKDYHVCFCLRFNKNLKPCSHTSKSCHLLFSVRWGWLPYIRGVDRWWEFMELGDEWIPWQQIHVEGVYYKMLDVAVLSSL